MVVGCNANYGRIRRRSSNHSWRSDFHLPHAHDWTWRCRSPNRSCGFSTSTSTGRRVICTALEIDYETKEIDFPDHEAGQVRKSALIHYEGVKDSDGRYGSKTTTTPYDANLHRIGSR